MSMTRQQVTLLGIFALFLAPMLVVMLMQSGWWQYQPAGMKNNGHLIQPPVRLPLAPAISTTTAAHHTAIEGKWLLLYRLPASCGQQCIDDIANLRQVHKATGRQQQHLALVLLAGARPDPELETRVEAIYSNLEIIFDDSGAIGHELDRIEFSHAEMIKDGGRFGTYVIDPMQHAVLAFTDNAGPGDILKDLKRLLKWSTQENRP